MIFLRGATAGAASRRTVIHPFRPKEGASLLHFKLSSEIRPKGTGKCLCVRITL